MLKILVISDSHGFLENIVKIYRKEMPDIIIGAGDHIEDMKNFMYAFDNKEIITVLGNCDYLQNAVENIKMEIKYISNLDKNFSNYEIEKIFEIRNKKILLVHGHHYDVKQSKNKLEKRAEEKGVDIVIFGHTHIKYFENKKGIFYFNPGSIGNNEYGIIEISDDKIEFIQKNMGSERE